MVFIVQFLGQLQGPNVGDTPEMREEGSRDRSLVVGGRR